MMDVKILYEDKYLIVVLKPPGMPSQSDRGSALDMVSYLKYYLSKTEKGEPYISVVHRLDRPVGGIMVYARDKKAAADLSRQIQSHQVSKWYKVVLTGTLKENKKEKQGTLENYLLKDAKTNTSSVVGEKVKGAKLARLNYEITGECLYEGKVLTFADIELMTGRHHQIRVQTAFAGAGIYGDTKYNPEFQGRKGWFNIGLFSYRLAFTHPVTKKQMCFEYEPDIMPFNLIQQNRV